MFTKGAGDTPEILDCQPDGCDNLATARDIVECIDSSGASLPRNGTCLDPAIGAQIFNMAGLVVRGRHANLSGRYLSQTNA